VDNFLDMLKTMLVIKKNKKNVLLTRYPPIINNLSTFCG